MSSSFKYHSRMPSERQQLMNQILWTLALDGPIEDPNGFAAARLVEALAARRVKTDVGAVSQIINGLEEGGRYTQEDADTYVVRQINGKRCYSIALTVDPETVPFPKNPFRGKKQASPVETQDHQDVELVAVRATVEQPAELVPVAATYDDSSVHDKLLYAISLLNDANLQLARQPATDLSSLIDGRLEAANRLLSDNDRLRSDVEELRNENRVLRRANEELQRTLHSMQGQLRSSNGNLTRLMS